jgi:hypothetical protein
LFQLDRPRRKVPHAEFCSAFLSFFLQFAAAPFLDHEPETPMYLVREIMYCKPGKVRALVDKFKAMQKLSEKVGMPKMRMMTDMCAERYWTLVSEMEVPSLQAFEDMMQNPKGSPEDLKAFEKLMEGYHDLVDYGKREIYRIEG